LAQTRRTKTILVGGGGDRKPERFGRAPAAITKPAIERAATAGTGEAAGACFGRNHVASLRADGVKRKNVIRRKPNHAYGRCMAIPWIVDFVGAAGALLTTLCWLPQVLKTVREKETRALSLPATSAFTLGILLWLIYGIAIGDWPLIGSNAATLALMAPILAMKLRYG
jgi:MtN3 and saliva related transmembrane protein